MSTVRLSDFEITIEPDEVLLREGAHSIELAREIFADRSVEISGLELKEFIDKKQKVYRKITEAKIENGTEPFLKSLKQRGKLIGLVTGTVRLNIEHSHSPEFIELFDTITTADDIKNGKPNPECFLRDGVSLRRATSGFSLELRVFEGDLEKLVGVSFPL